MTARGCLELQAMDGAISAPATCSRPQARARRLSGSAARPFAPPSLYYLNVPHTTVRLNARALALIYRRRERLNSLVFTERSGVKIQCSDLLYIFYSFSQRIQYIRSFGYTEIWANEVSRICYVRRRSATLIFSLSVQQGMESLFPILHRQYL